ncbi:family 1 glycosylhydrolase [Rufibacter sp. LB8]|uniref:family 1 glycosylhydrolase n=1 Tax=Rufibacter sp. LB8 TaxID=2777781 RepID=UPI00178C2307|nr:family 1 glycosylhydrolase [Rufibacter sp. LB8]
MADINLWGGVECTVNRVGDQYFDQLAQSGHDHRVADLDLFADLGLQKIRYPVLWEHVAPEAPDQFDFTWAQERLERLRELNINPIVGLLHHGSGPHYTNLLDPDFPEKFASYAKAVATQFPWVTNYTPINEPLTTARFSALYGLWYPHHRSDASFVTALLNQIKGTRLAMAAIRQINPAAQLVQTDDLGYSHSTSTLEYQADFENHRRWLTWDLLSGKVDEQHPLWEYLVTAGASIDELLELVANPCPPDIIGVNYYVTSERYLDERITDYPLHTHGNNQQHRYADVEAVRVSAATPLGVKTILEQACDRYQLPVAITEAHLGCTREEQIRWLAEVWDSALCLRNEGKNVIAVTAWSLLGSFDWNSLLTQQRGFYEPGIFDIRSGEPAPTAAAQLLKSFTFSEERHAVLQVDGWWKRACRSLFPQQEEEPENFHQCLLPDMKTPQPLIITGATGTLGRAFARLCSLRGIPYVLLNRQELDITQPESIESALEKYQPWGVVNCAGYVRVDDAEKESDACLLANAQGPTNLAHACRMKGIQLATFSSDLVFDGQKEGAYLEHDPPNPLNVYGQSKALAEEQVLAAMPTALVIRTSAFFGPWDQHNFVFYALRAFAHGEEFTAAQDTFITPTYVPDLVNTTLDLLIDQEHGLWHVANTGAYSWADLAETAARIAGLPFEPYLKRVAQAEFGLPARRPVNTALGTAKRAILPTVEDALQRFLYAGEISFRPDIHHAQAQEEATFLAAQA